VIHATLDLAEKLVDPAIPSAPSPTGELQFHPIANVFPLIEGRDFDDLVEDIRKHGLREPITLLDGRILDGRNRYRACQRAGVDARATAFTYDGNDPIAFVVSLNLRRRHLDESQRAMVAARIATLPKGSNQHTPIGASSVPTQSQAADMLNVGHRNVQRARQVIDHGAPELVAAVDRGEVAVSAAVEVAQLSEAEQRAVVADGTAAEVAKQARLERTSPQLLRAVPMQDDIAGPAPTTVMLDEPVVQEEPGEADEEEPFEDEEAGEWDDLEGDARFFDEVTERALKDLARAAKGDERREEELRKVRTFLGSGVEEFVAALPAAIVASVEPLLRGGASQVILYCIAAKLLRRAVDEAGEQALTAA
jgi:hypothetical protein